MLRILGTYNRAAEYLVICSLLLMVYAFGGTVNAKQVGLNEVLGVAPAIIESRDDKVQKIIDSWQNQLGAKSAVFIKEIDSGKKASINQDQQIISASLYKYYVAYQLLLNQDKKPNTLNNQLSNGKTAGECLAQMIVISDNQCSELLGKFVGWANVDKTLKNLGMESTRVNNYTVNGDYRGNKKTTARELGEFIEKLYKRQLLSNDSTELFIRLLSRQKLNERIPVKLPVGISIGHKTGTLEDNRHDAGIIFDSEGNDVVFVVMTHGWSETNISKADASIKQLLNRIITAHENQKRIHPIFN